MSCSPERPRLHRGNALPTLAANLTTQFREVPFAARFAAAAAQGFRHVEYQFPYESGTAAAVAGWARAAGVEVVLHNITAGNEAAGDRGIASLPDRVDEFRAGVAQALEYARAAGCRRLNCLAGLHQPGVERSRQLATLVANAQYAADQLRPHGLELMIEAVALLPGFLITNTVQSLAIIDAVQRPNVRLQYDLFQMHLAGENLESQLRTLLPRIGHIQVADAPGRHEPGTGAIDYARLLPFIDELGYRGTVGCEYFPRAGTVEGLGWARRWLQPGA